MKDLERLHRRLAHKSNQAMQQLECSDTAHLAALIICKSEWAKILKQVGDRALRDMGWEKRGTGHYMPRDCADWPDLLEWRHPRIDLNLLQLAVIFDNSYFVEYLWRPIFAREENYRDENASLVNHPVHLACILGHSSTLEVMGDLADEILCEEGTVDLSQTRIQRSTSSDNELLLLKKRNRSRVGRISYAMSPVSGAPMSLTDKEDSKCVPLLFARLLTKVTIRVETPLPSTVENVWNSVEDLSRRGLSADEFRGCMEKLLPDIRLSCGRLSPLSETAGKDSSGVRKNQVFHREVSILACQLLACVNEDTESFAASLKALWSNLITMAYVGDIDFMQKAASYLPKKHLPNFIRHLKDDYRDEYKKNSSSNRVKNIFSGLERIEALAGETSLQHLCMLKILASVRGEARAARNLSVLPEPLRQRFHVPFQDLYDQITAESAWHLSRWEADPCHSRRVSVQATTEV